MSDNRDIKAKTHNRDKDRVIAASAGAIAGAAGIIAAQVSMQSDEDIAEQSDNNIANISTNTGNVEVCAVSLDDSSSDEVIVCDVESCDSSEVEVLVAEVECSSNEVFNINTIGDILSGDTNLYSANTDDFLNDIDVNSCDMAYEFQFDGEILA